MRILDFRGTEKLLKHYKIPLVRTKAIKSAAEVGGFKYPLVLKVFGPNIMHRTEKGLVEVCGDKKELERSWKRLYPFISGRADKSKQGNIILVQEKAEGLELFAGMKRDPTFGPVIAFGLGGIFIELFRDVALGLAPLDKRKALKMIKRTKTAKALQGYRGLPLVDLLEVSGILVRVSRLSLEHPEIREIDLNPIFAKAGRIAAADFKFYVE